MSLVPQIDVTGCIYQTGRSIDNSGEGAGRGSSVVIRPATLRKKLKTLNKDGIKVTHSYTPIYYATPSARRRDWVIRADSWCVRQPRVDLIG